MSRIDYSKWDKLEISDSDSDLDEKPRPIVTKLDKPSSVTFGKQTAEIKPELKPVAQSSAQAKYGVDYSKWDKLEVSDEEEESVSSEEISPSPRPQQALVPAQQSGLDHYSEDEPYEPYELPEVPDLNGLKLENSYEQIVTAYTRKGSQRDFYLWTQTKSQVVAR